MFVECTAEAEVVSALAVHAGHDLWKLSFFYVAIYSVYAVWSRTPLQVVKVVDVGSREEFVISKIY